MHLHTDRTRIQDGGDIARYNGSDTGFAGGIDYRMTFLYVIVIYHGVDRQIGLYSMLVTGSGYGAEVVKSEIIG